MQSLSDEELSAKTDLFRENLKQNKEAEGLLTEAFAVVREASQRTLGLRHYDVQLIGGMVLNEGSIAEMATGEGKTLVATLPAYINALAGDGVHIVTVNDYLARRDAEWMGKVFNFLGLEVGVVTSGMSGEEKNYQLHLKVQELHEKKFTLQTLSNAGHQKIEYQHQLKEKEKQKNLEQKELRWQ